MAETLTRPTQVAVAAFIAELEPPAKRADALAMEPIFARATGVEARMWGPTMIGYGHYSYRYASGHGGEMFRAGFSPRRARHSLYLLSCDDASEEAAFAPLLARLGKFARGKSCLYVNKLADIDLAVLEQMVALAWARSFERWPD